MFSPNLGRWATMDPIGYVAGDVNLYRSEGNNPITGLDPSGLEELKIRGKQLLKEVWHSPNLSSDVYLGQLIGPTTVRRNINGKLYYVDIEVLRIEANRTYGAEGASEWNDWFKTNGTTGQIAAPGIPFEENKFAGHADLPRMSDDKLNGKQAAGQSATIVKGLGGVVVVTAATTVASMVPLGAAGKAQSVGEGIAGWLQKGAKVEIDTSTRFRIVSQDGKRVFRVDWLGHDGNKVPHCHLEVWDDALKKFVDAPGTPHGIPFK